MHDEQPRSVKTGGDPRLLSEFTALRDEMSKLMHPARPDVDWKRVESLSLSLFEINGVELQTCAWYTLARSHLARVNGLNEGLAILNALLSHQWVQLWPQPAHARLEILNGLSQRVQKLFRTFSLGPADVPALALAEKQLLAMKDVLMRQELSHACQIDPLVQQIRSALARFEHSPQPEGQDPVLVLSEEAVPVSRLVYIIQKEPDVDVQVREDARIPPKRWPAFAAGMATALILSAAIAWGWQTFQQPDEATQAMAASVADMPALMTPSQIEAFRETESSQLNAQVWLPRMADRLRWVKTMTPGWQLRYGQGLVSQAKALWPQDPATRALAEQWQQYRLSRTLPASELNDWHDGMMQLQALSAQLDALDRQKGKYLTGSELKTLVWRITSAFASAVPVEEQLRQLDSARGTTGASQADIEQVARHLDSLIHILEQMHDPDGLR